MASITIRNLDDAVKQNLRVRAAQHGRSMEEEARDILRRAVELQDPVGNLGASIHRRFAPHGGSTWICRNARLFATRPASTSSG